MKQNKKHPRAKNPRVRKSTVVFTGKIFHVTREEVVEPGKISAMREIVRHPGSVVILAVDESDREPKVLLERQYRHASGRTIWELPAGKIDAGESALTGAKRELLEETGYRAKRWEKLLHFWVSPGFLDETMTIFLARGLSLGEATPEADEHIHSELVPLSKVIAMITSGKIPDAKTTAIGTAPNARRISKRAMGF